MEEIRNEYFFIDPEDNHKIDLCEKNRPLVLSHVKKIEKALKKNSRLFLNSVMVGYRDGIVEIIDGHHRWKAINNLYKQDIKYDDEGNRIKLRFQIIPYNVNLDELMVAINNSSLKWSILNFVQFNAFRGNEYCTRFLNFMEKNSITNIGYAFAYFGKQSITKRQAEDFERFPEITENMVNNAQHRHDVINLILALGKYDLLKSLKLNTAVGVRVFVQFLNVSFLDKESITKYASTLINSSLTSRDLMQNFESTHLSTTEAYLKDLYEHLYELLNK